MVVYNVNTILYASGGRVKLKLFSRVYVLLFYFFFFCTQTRIIYSHLPTNERFQNKFFYNVFNMYIVSPIIRLLFARSYYKFVGTGWRYVEQRVTLYIPTTPIT